MELGASRYAKNTLLKSTKIFHYREFHSENLFFFSSFLTQIDPWPISGLVPLGQGHPEVQARPEASLEPRKLNTSHDKCKSSFIFAIVLYVFEDRCHQVLYFTRKSAPRQRHGLRKGFKAPLPTPLEPLSASTVWGI